MDEAQQFTVLATITECWEHSVGGFSGTCRKPSTLSCRKYGWPTAMWLLVKTTLEHHRYLPVICSSVKQNPSNTDYAGTYVMPRWLILRCVLRTWDLSIEFKWSLYALSTSCIAPSTGLQYTEDIQLSHSCFSLGKCGSIEPRDDVATASRR